MYDILGLHHLLICLPIQLGIMEYTWLS